MSPLLPIVGNSCELKMKVEKGADQCYVAIDVNNMYGDPIMNFSSHITMDEFKLTPGIHEADLDIPKLPLTAGIYRLTLWANAKNPLISIICGDCLRDVIKLKVEEDDFFGRGKNIGSHLLGKVVLCDYSWSVH